MAPLAQPLKGHIKHGNEEDAEGAREQHAGEDRGGDAAPADLRCAVRDDERQEPQNEGERGHHHRAEPHPRAQRGGVFDGKARLALLLGEFDDEDAVLGGERDQHDEPDLGI